MINLCGGRYWDRTSDPFGVNQDAACPSSSGNATTRRNAGAVQSNLMHHSAVQCRSEQRCAPQLLPICIQAPARRQNLRRGHYELAVDTSPATRVAAAFTELAGTI
jgi:hypothetical protein